MLFKFFRIPLHPQDNRLVTKPPPKNAYIKIDGCGSWLLTSYLLKRIQQTICQLRPAYSFFGHQPDGQYPAINIQNNE